MSGMSYKQQVEPISVARWLDQHTGMRRQAMTMLELLVPMQQSFVHCRWMLRQLPDWFVGDLWGMPGRKGSPRGRFGNRNCLSFSMRAGQPIIDPTDVVMTQQYPKRGGIDPVQEVWAEALAPGGSIEVGWAAALHLDTERVYVAVYAPRLQRFFFPDTWTLRSARRTVLQAGAGVLEEGEELWVWASAMRPELEEGDGLWATAEAGGCITIVQTGSAAPDAAARAAGAPGAVEGAAEADAGEPFAFTATLEEADAEEDGPEVLPVPQVRELEALEEYGSVYVAWDGGACGPEDVVQLGVEVVETGLFHAPDDYQLASAEQATVYLPEGSIRKGQRVRLHLQVMRPVADAEPWEWPRSGGLVLEGRVELTG